MTAKGGMQKEESLKLQDCFESFLQEFQRNIDFYFKNFNKNLKENIEIQIKGTKKEKLRYQQFLIVEEKEFWKDFPRKKGFYQSYLRKINDIFQSNLAKMSGSSASKDASLILTNILNILPVASEKYCKKFGMDAIFHQDSENKITFDTITEQLKMFDSDDLKNWRILGFTITIFGVDIIKILFDQIMAKEVKDIQISHGLIDIILEICKYFTVLQTFQEEGIEEETIYDSYFKQAQTSWAQVFGNLSQLQFDKCMKFMMSALQQDFRKLKEEELSASAHKIHFCRFLQIIPVDKLMASHVQVLLDSMNSTLSTKSVSHPLKNVILMTLKFLIEQLQFYNDHGQDFNLDSPMGILWPVVEQLFKVCEKFKKKETLKDCAFQLLLIIIKISPIDFFLEKMNKVIKRQKIMSYFETKKTYQFGVQLIMEISCPKTATINKYQYWKPKLQERSYFIIEDKTFNVIQPVKEFSEPQQFKLMRRMHNDQIPYSFRESIKYVFNPKVCQDINHLQYLYLQQMAFEDLDFLCNSVLQQLMWYLKNQERYDLPLLAFKIIDFLINPKFDFKGHYLKLRPNEAKSLNENLQAMQQYISIVIKEILRSSLLKTDFILDLCNFFKSEDKELCNDQMGIIWANELDYSQNIIANNIKNKGIGKFYLQEEKRVISFEEFRELQMHQQTSEEPTYANDNFNLISRGIQKEMQDWDFKKEDFMRHRLACFLSEERKEAQRQNTTLYSMNSVNSFKQEEIKLVKYILRMIHYLPEVHEYFKFYPTRRLLIEDMSMLTNRSSEMSYQDLDEGQPNILSFQGQNTLSGEEYRPQLALGLNQATFRKKKSEPKFGLKLTSNKLRECQNLIGYYLMSAKYDICQCASEQLQQLIIFGDFKTRIAMIDQILYMLKEVMIDTPEEYLIQQLLHQLISMIKVWHNSEKNKIKVNQSYLKDKQIDNYEIIDINPYQSYQENTDSNANEMINRMQNYQYIFDVIDMISLIGMCNKDRLTRQLSVILTVESGKLKRLLIPKNNYKKGLYDYLYYNQEQYKEQIVKLLLVYHSFKSQEFKSQHEWTSLINEISIYQLIIDNFDYKKSGMSESLVRDIQIILIGEIFISWKKQLLESSENAHSIINFVNQLSSRTLNMFEQKGEGTTSKDYVGMNMLLALVLYNISCDYSDNNQEIQQFPSLTQLFDLEMADVHKTAFGKFYPQKFTISSIMIAYLYMLQDPVQPRSLENLKRVFQIERAQNNQSIFFKNCLIFYSLLSLNCNQRLLTYLVFDRKYVMDFVVKLDYYMFNESDLNNDINQKQKLILYINYMHSLITIIKNVYSKEEYNEIKKLIKTSYQYEMLEFTKNEYLKIQQSSQKKELEWLLVKIKEIWQMILSLELIFEEIPNIKLDLKFLIDLESQDYKVLKYYKYLNNNNNLNTQKRNLQEDVQQEFTVNELKYLLNQVYLFYHTRTNTNEQILKKNPYYKCFIANIVGADQLLVYLRQKNFNQVYGQLTSSCLRSTKALIETKIKQFISNSLHSKYFLVGIFMSLNSMEKKVIERSKILCLAVLPLMFEDEKFRELVESQIAEHEDLRNLVAFDNKNFYRFVKQVFKDEETYNMRNHFEKYFSMSGLLRNVLNEIIKLQGLQFSQKMLLKILDIITYFIGNIQLRRAPQVDSNAFIFDNLIDYKSFEFLSKLYKISEKLVDYDDETVVMNMWYKLVENRVQNFEILAKFLVHNLSSYTVKLKADKDEKGRGDKETEYSIEYEKQRRYAMSIFNYIKARVIQMDLRNSINFSANSVTWSQKMVKLMTRTALNIQSKYVLEKVKLKKILQLIHTEINECGVRLQLKGGLSKNSEFVMGNHQRVSVNMSQLLQSQTFVETFAAKNRKQQTIMKNLLFRVRRIMNEKFNEIAQQKSIDQMPELIMKYIENSLIFITNDVERPTQQIKFTLKEEFIIVISMIILTVDLIVKEKNESRFYQILETFNKLSIHVPSIQKFFNFKNYTVQKIYSKELQAKDKIWLVVNLKASLENFALYTKLHFKMVMNLYGAPFTQYQLIRMWLVIFQKHRENMNQAKSPMQQSISGMLQMKAQEAMVYSRNLILTLMQSTYYNFYEMSQVRRELSQNDFNLYVMNFRYHFNCILEYVIPTGSKGQQIKSLTDPESLHIAFANNSVFWIAYSCLECASMSFEQKSSAIEEFQFMGMKAIRKVLEESDFLKMLIGISKLSPNFFSYSLSLSKKQSSFLQLIFDALENSLCQEDALKSLIITIRIYDYEFLNASNNRELAEMELQRLILLLPFLQQQFTYIMKSSQLAGKQPIFTSYRSIIQLLKKSLPSIGIDKKKDVFDSLDFLQKEAEKNEEKLIKKEFENLINSTVGLCYQLGYISLVFHCERVLGMMRREKGEQGFIDNDKIDLCIKVINEFIVNNELMMPDGVNEDTHKIKMKHDLTEFVYNGEILGEETSQIKLEMRPLYFGLKNIIIKEIESIDKDIDIQKFFFDQVLEKQEPTLLMASQNSAMMGKRSLQAATQEAMKNLNCDSIDMNTPSEQETRSLQKEGSFTNIIKKISTKKQETASKYQNSQAASLIKVGSTPSEKRIVSLGQDLPSLQRIQTLGQPQNPILALNKPTSGKYQQNTTTRISGSSKMEEFGSRSPMYHDKLQSNNHYFEDEDIHVPVTKTLSSNLLREEVKKQKSIKDQQREIVLKDDEDDEFEQPCIIDNSFDREDFEVIQEQNELNNMEVVKEEQVHSSSSEDPRVKLKQVIETNKRNQLLSNNVSPMKPVIQQQPEQYQIKSFTSTQNAQHHTQRYMEMEQYHQPNKQSIQQKIDTQIDMQRVVESDAGGIVTFMKPKTQQYEIQQKHHHQQQKSTQQQRQSRPLDNLLNPNYVADRTSKIFNEISSSQQSLQKEQQVMDSQVVFNEDWKNVMLRQKKKEPTTTSKYPWLHEQLQSQPEQQVMKSQKHQPAKNLSKDESARIKANNFFQSMKGKEELPTPKRSNQLDSQLIQFLNDKEQFYQFEKFLNNKKYDVDLLHFYIKVMEFKKEQDSFKAKVAAGTIIDKYMGDEAESYINIETRLVSQVINDYKRFCFSDEPIDSTLFDLCTHKIEKELLRFVNEYQKLNY